VWWLESLWYCDAGQNHCHQQLLLRVFDWHRLYLKRRHRLDNARRFSDNRRRLVVGDNGLSDDRRWIRIIDGWPKQQSAVVL